LFKGNFYFEEKKYLCRYFEGVACLLLVSYHVIGSNDTNGLRLSDGLYRELNDVFLFIRMPLFTFLSGFIYAFRPYESNAKKYINGKAKRLLIPMLTVGTAFAITQYLVPGSNESISSWYTLHIIPVAHFWFIESIFLIFILMIPLEKYGVLSHKLSFLFVFILSALLFISNINIQYFSLSGFIYLLPFFLLGLAVKRFNLLLFLNIKILSVASTLLVFLLISIFTGFIEVDSKRSLLSLFIGGVSCYLLLGVKFESKFLAKIGLFSYSIYLYHVFFTAGSRIIFLKLGISDINLLFILSLSTGVIGPIFIENKFNNFRLTRLTLLGKSRESIKKQI